MWAKLTIIYLYLLLAFPAKFRLEFPPEKIKYFGLKVYPVFAGVTL
jgi:hypothetical protein